MRHWPLGLALVFLTATGTVSCLRYRECRAHGFSLFYCVGQR